MASLENINKKRGIVEYTKINESTWIQVYTDGFTLIKKLLHIHDFLERKELPPKEEKTVIPFSKCVWGKMPNYSLVLSGKFKKKDIQIDRELLIKVLQNLDNAFINIHIEGAEKPLEIKGKNERVLIMPIKPKQV